MRWPQVHIVYRLASPGSRSNICDSSFATGMVIIIIIQRLAWKSCRHLGSSEEFFLRICVFHVIVESSSIHTTGDPSRDFHSSVRPIPFHSLCCCHFCYDSFHQNGSPPAAQKLPLIRFSILIIRLSTTFIMFNIVIIIILMLVLLRRLL